MFIRVLFDVYGVQIKIVEVVEYVEGTHQIIEEIIRIRAIVFVCTLY